MTHAEFVDAYAAGRITVAVDPAAASRYLSARLMLPFFAMPVIGIGIALALIGWVWTGLALMALAYIGPRLIKRSAPQFVLNQALQDESVYYQISRAGILQITPS